MINEGSVVELKSGGNIMTVTRLFNSGGGERLASCAWFANGELAEANIAVVALQEVVF